MKIVIMGATGKELLELMIASDKISAIAALAGKPMAIPHPNLQVTVVDFGRLADWQEYNR